MAFVLGLMVVLALSLSAYYAYKTRSKIWLHGKSNILWDEPLLRPGEEQDVHDWVSLSLGVDQWVNRAHGSNKTTADIPIGLE